MRYRVEINCDDDRLNVVYPTGEVQALALDEIEGIDVRLDGFGADAAAALHRFLQGLGYEIEVHVIA